MGRSKSADRLRKLLPRNAVLDDPLQLSMYGYDGTFYEGRADLAVLPETTEQAAAAVRFLHDAGIPVIPRGAATSLSGGPVPVQGGAVVSFSRMDRVLELDYENHLAVVQPGVVNQDFQKILAAADFFYAPDPASQSVCTLGGNIGENSGGPHCLKYGVTANHVMGLTFVLPDGRAVEVGGASLDGPGLDLTGLIVGSEGTFGLATEITCRIMPQPDAVATMLAIFDSLAGATQSVSDIIAAGIIPATLEMMDNPMIQAIEKHLNAGYPLDAEAVLIVEVDGLKVSLDRQIACIEEVCKGNQVRSFRVAANEKERALLWKGRKGAFGAVTNIMPSKICTDVSVPRTELPKMLASVMEISRKWDIPITNVFHAGDGNLHPLILFDPRDEDQFRRAKNVDQEITQLAMKHGGVLTGEHGIGCGKRRYMLDVFSPSELRLMWRVKEAFDPDCLCNPGKVLPDKGDIAPVTPPDLPGGSFESAAAQLSLTGDRNHLRPAVHESAAKLLALAGREGRRVVLRGGGTKSAPPHEDVWALDLSGFDRIISLDHANLTVTAEAGVTIEELETALAEHGQMLGLRPRFASRATIGGMVSTADSGPNRLLYGTPRDRLLGVKAALPTGEIVRFGGACVKNVAGYAIEKLLTGSHGTLAAVLEATLRTFPRPESRVTMSTALATPSQARPFLARLLRSGLRPAAVELLNPAAMRLLGAEESRWRLYIGLEGFAEDTAEMTRRIAATSAEDGLTDWQQDTDDYIGFWDRVTDLFGGRSTRKLSCRLTAVPGLAEEMDALDAGVPLRVSPGLGLVLAAVENDPADYVMRTEGLLERHRAQSCWLAPVPPGVSDAVDPIAAELRERLKRAFDPKGVLPDLP